MYKFLPCWLIWREKKECIQGELANSGPAKKKKRAGQLIGEVRAHFSCITTQSQAYVITISILCSIVLITDLCISKLQNRYYLLQKSVQNNTAFTIDDVSTSWGLPLLSLLSAPCCSFPWVFTLSLWLLYATTPAIAADCRKNGVKEINGPKFGQGCKIK